MAIISWNKKYTETLTETLARFRKCHPEYQNSKVTYAGRLDPMASGLVLLLTDEDVYKKDDYLSLGKVYEVDFVLGPKTDTLDILGLIVKDSLFFEKINRKKEIKNICLHLLGEKKQQYPVFSSKPVQGKPLFWWARNNKLSNIVIPSKKINIYKVNYLQEKKIYPQNFLRFIKHSVCSVEGDFRQKQITELWEKYFALQETNEVFIYRIQMSVSSGTYVRKVIDDLGKELHIPATCIHIRRLSVGNFLLKIDDHFNSCYDGFI